jgi:hypothetical protein
VAVPTPPVLPRYGADWIGGVVPAILRGEHPEWFPGPARDARQVVLLVLDGFGADIARWHAGRLPNLSAMVGGEITSVLPSTTSAGLTSISTAAVPAVHGMVGYRFRLGGQIINAVQWKVPGGGPLPDPVTAQPVPPFLGEAVPVVNREEFRSSGFTRAHLRGGSFHAWSDPDQVAAGIADALMEQSRLVYAYDDRVDKMAHAKGMASDEFMTALASVDATVGAVLDRLPSDVALVVTADHGQVEADRALLIDLAELSPYVSMTGGEARFRHLHAAAGAAGELLARAHAAYGEIAWVRTREELAASGWLGARPGLSVSSRIGDVALIARGGYGFIDPDFSKEGDIRSMHGACSAAEMMVPLVAARGRRR